MVFNRWRSLAVFAMLGAGPMAWADSDYTEGTLTGDWNGARSRWAESGVEVSANFKADVFYNHGGLKSGTQSMLQTDLGIAADFQKLYDWQGMSGYLQVIDDRGGRSNGRHVGSFMGVSNLEVDPASTRLFHAWLQKSSEGDRFSALFGLYPVDSEFSVIETAGMFSHPAYGPTADMSLTNLPSIFPISALGLRLRGQTEDGQTYAQMAVLDGVAGDPNDPKGTHIRFKDGEGAFVIAEVGRVRPAPDTGEAAPGKLAFGLWGYTARGDDLVDRDGAGNPVQRRRFGGYVLGETRLADIEGNAARGIDGFFRISASDGDSSPLEHALNLGMRINGPLASRPQDAVGIAYTRGNVGSKYRQAQAAVGVATTDYEDALEIDYRMAVNAWLVVQPQIQHIRHPSADPTIRDSTVYGVRVEVAL